MNEDNQVPAYGTKVDYLTRELSRQIIDYQARRARARLVTTTVRIAQIVISSLTTLTLGFQGFSRFRAHAETMSMIALVLSATLAALTAWDAFAGHAQQWIRDRTILYKLFDIRDDLAYLLTAESSPSDELLDKLYARLKAVHSALNEEWVGQRASAITAQPGR